MMRTKTAKESKKVSASDLKINLSVPKVVLDASDCAKFLDGTGKTSVILVERGGKIVPASSSSSSHGSSCVQLSSSSFSSRSSTSTKSLSSTKSQISTVVTTSSKVCHDLSSHTCTDPKETHSKASNNSQKDMADQSEFSPAFVQDPVSLEQEKVILKPPKKRRGNDKGAYEDSSACPLVNGEAGRGVESVKSNAVPVGEAKEAVALRSTPSFPVVPASSNSLQKHTIENLLQVSPSSSANNNNNSSSNMNLISGPYDHPSYHSIPLPLHSTPIHDMCSQTTIPLPALPTATSSSSGSTLTTQPALSQQILASPSSITSSTSPPKSSSVLHKISPEPSPHTDLDSSHMYSYSNQIHPSQTHSVIKPVLDSDFGNVPILAPAATQSPLGASESMPQSPANSQPRFHRPIEQDEPINLSTCSKSEENANLSPPVIVDSKDCGKNSAQNESVPQSESTPFMENVRPAEGKVSSIVPSGAWKQNSDLSYAETNGIPHLKDEQPFQNESVVVRTSSLSKKIKVASLKNNGHEGVDQDSSGGSTVAGGDLRSEKCSHEEEESSQSNMTLSDADGKNQNGVRSPLNVDIIDSPATSDQQAHFDKKESEAISNPSVSKITSPDDATNKVKSKKANKKKADVPMDEESCAIRSIMYSESIDHVIHHFEYVSEPVDDICLTEEEEAILRQQFDDNNTICPEKGASGKEVLGIDPNLDCMAVSTQTGGHKKSVKSHSSEVSLKGVSKSHLKGEFKKLPKEKLSPCVQNVINVLSIVAADFANYASPSEAGLADLEATLKSLTSKYRKKVLQLSDDSLISDDKTDAKAVSLLERAKKTLNDISAFYPGENDFGIVKTSANEDTSLDMESVDSNSKSVVSCHENLSTEGELKNKVKKIKKRKSDPDESNCSEGVKSSSLVTKSEAGISKPKKVKKTGSCKKKSLSESVTGSSQSSRNDDDATVTVQPISESSFLTTCKMETSDIGESIASTSGGSEQVTPVHEPETKDEGVNTNQLDFESHDTGLDSGTEDKDNKPVRHYKKRLDFVKCPQCEHQSRGRSALSRHMKKVHLLEADMPYKCHLCTYGCTKMASLNRHLFTHSVFPCSRCDFKTEERDKLTEHIAEHHRDKLDMKLCKVCNRYIKCEDFTIEEHTEKCEGPVPYKCTECSKEFKYASSLRVHYHTHFPDEPKRFKCELCDYRTNYKANLHKHHKNMHATKDRNVQCPDCGKMFSTEDNMRRHRKVHTLVQAFGCDICKKTFKTSSGLKGHQLIHTATRPFACNIPGCSKTFRTPKFLKGHQEEFHRLVPKKFFCHVEGCNYSFFKRSHLKRHAITHTGERNYHCTYPGCSKSFRHADNLKVHFRGHTNEKPIQCHLCDFKCKQKNSLFWHKKKVHQIVEASSIVTSKSGDNNKIKTEVLINADSQTEASNENVKYWPESMQPSEISLKKTSSCSDMENSPSSQGLLPECTVTFGVSSMDLYEFKSEGESEEEGPSPLRWETVKSAPTAPLPPAPKELLLKIEREEKKERDKMEKAERKEQLKKEKADKKEQEKKDKAVKKEQEKKERLEKKEQEKKEKEEKKELEKREKLEQKEKDKKEKEEQKEKEKKEKEELKEKEKKEKEELKEKEKEEKEKKKMEKIEEREKLKKEKQAQKEKEKKEKERRRLEVKRLKEDAKKLLQKSSARSSRGIPKRTWGAASLKSTAVKAKKSLIKLRKKTPARGASQKIVEEKKAARGRKKTQAPPKDQTLTKEKPVDGRKKRGWTAKSPSNNSNDKLEKPPSRAASPRAASPRGATNKKPSSSESKSVTAVRGKKKALVIPKRKPSARIRANKKIQEKKKKSPVVVKKTVKMALAKNTGGKRGRPGRKKAAEVNNETSDTEGDNEALKAKEEDKEVEKPPEKAAEESKQNTSVEKADKGKKSPPRAPSPSSSEEDMLQGKASPYRDFSDAENMEEDEEEVEKEESSLESSLNEEAGEVENPCVAPNETQDSEKEAVDCTKPDEEENCTGAEQSEIYPEDSSDDEGINDIPLTPPRAPAPPPVESSEDEMEPDALDSSAPYSTPAPNTPFSVPGPNTPFSVPPPTNLMQQHSVHSEEMATGVSSVTSIDMPSAGSVETQQAQGSVESHPSGGSVEMHPRGSIEMHSHGSVEMHPHGSVEMHPHGSVEMHPHGSVEMHPHGSVEMHPHGSVEMHPHGSVEMHPHGSVEMHPHGSVEMHPHGSVEMHPHGSVEMHSHGSVEIHPQGSVELHPQGSVEIHHRNSTEMHPQHTPMDLPQHVGPVEMRPGGPSEMHSHPSMEIHQHNSATDIHSHSSLERSHSHAPADIQHMPQPLPQTDATMPGDLSSAPSEIGSNVNMPPQDKFSLPPGMEDTGGSTAEADKRYFDQYLKDLSAANNQAAREGGLMEGPEARNMLNKSPTNTLQPVVPTNTLQPVVPTSVITSLEASSSLYSGQADLRRMEAMVGERHHQDSLYARDTVSALPRLPERQSTATPLLPTSHAAPTPSFDAFPSLNPLHSSSATVRDGTPYLRQQENLFATPPVTSSFMAEAMFQRQSMTTPFLPPPPQPTDRNSLSRIPDPAASLRSNNTSSFLRRAPTVPGTEMFATPTVPQTVPRHPLSNAWSGQEVRPTHWQNPYLPRQPNMPTANNPFFPTKENYLASRDFMFDPSAVRSPTERGMFSSLASSQPQDSLQFDRFDLSNFFPSAVSPYGTTSSLDYTRTSHTAAPKPFDDRYRQTAAAASAALPDFRGLPPTTGSTDMFSGIGVNSGFNLYPGNHSMPYHPQHMTDNMNSAFLTHPTTAQHAMLERDYAAAAAHRGLYPHHHQNSYPFIDDRQYSGSSKLAHSHTTPTTMPQERDLMSRSAAPESQMQDPYRSVLYRY